MGLKYTCDICGRECDIATDAHPEPIIERYSVSVARSPEGWAIIWSPSKSKETGKLEAIPLAGERIACCFNCAERALAQIHREQLEFIFNYIPVRPETKLMSAIFGGWYEDDDLHQSVEGVSLKDTLFALLEEISQTYRRKSSGFAERINRVVALRFGFEDGRPRTLEEVGKEFDVSRERIRQHESLLLRLLRHPTKANRLKPFIKTREGG